MGLQIAEKLTGRFRYLTDDAPDGTLVGLVLRSPHPHARILRLDTEKAAAMLGVHAVETSADMPADFRYGLRLKDQPPLADGIVQFRGEPVAAVAAETMAEAKAALAAISVEYEILETVSDPHVALGEGGCFMRAGTFVAGSTTARAMLRRL
ncbi:hypothetical protein [Breoghania sp.]|uniref:hypothetical protein n=1 Tax=Breoghania sp. TaxID=2065378 RepID=UPI0026168512|nr:hypothetical protein [Breoghania sp.]MDJ0929763.1 hypothetical protein [Breoghania sp.]